MCVEDKVTNTGGDWDAGGPECYIVTALWSS